MQAKKSVEKMHVLINLRKAQLAKEANWVPEHPAGVNRTPNVIDRALSIVVRYCPPDYTYNPPVSSEMQKEEAVLIDLFTKMDKGTISEDEYRQLFLTIVNVQLAKGVLDIDTLLSLKQQEEKTQKHYEEHSPQVESAECLDDDEVLYSTEKKPHRFFNVVYETLISPRCLFGFGR